MNDVIATTFKELDILILENVLCYSKESKHWHGKNEWGRYNSYSEEEIPQFSKHPLHLRTMFKNLKKARVDITFHWKKKETWEVVITDHRQEFVAEDKFIHIAFIKAALKRENINTEVKIPKRELNEWGEWFSDLSSEYQIHVVTNSLHDQIAKMRFEEKKKELQEK